MSIESDVETLEEKAEQMGHAITVLADLVDDLARERHAAREHRAAYEVCGENVCVKARKATDLA